MAHLQMSHTRPVQEQWADLSDAENDAQTTAVFDVIAKHGGDVKALGFAMSNTTIVSMIEYPDLASAQGSVAAILALGTLEFVSVEELWDVTEWTQMVRKAATA
jgi:uncharacterized protein with GYD domain